MQTTNTTAFHSPQGKLIGVLTDGVYRKRAQKSKHFMRIFDAWGIEAHVVEAWNGRCSQVIIEETESSVTWETPSEIFVKKAFKRDFSTPQYFLEGKYWNVRDSKGRLIQERVILREELEERQGKLPL